MFLELRHEYIRYILNILICCIVEFYDEILSQLKGIFSSIIKISQELHLISFRS